MSITCVSVESMNILCAMSQLMLILLIVSLSVKTEKNCTFKAKIYSFKRFRKEWWSINDSFLWKSRSAFVILKFCLRLNQKYQEDVNALVVYLEKDWNFGQVRKCRTLPGEGRSIKLNKNSWDYYERPPALVSWSHLYLQ